MLINKMLFLLDEFFYKSVKILIFYLTQFFNVSVIRNFCVVITPRCNAKCKMCDLWAIDDMPSDLPLEKLEEILKSNSLKHVKTISITGGEPFLRKDIYQVHRLIRNYFPSANISISTNGLLHEEILNFLKKISEFGSVYLIISIDGIKSHDSMRGLKGAFEKTLGTLKVVRREFPKLPIAIKFTITPWNHKELFHAYELSQKEGVSFLIKTVDNLKEYTAIANYRKNKNRFSFDKNERDAIIADLKRIQTDQLKNRQFRSYIFTKELINYFSKMQYTLSYCTLPFYSLFINQTGKVYGCRKFKSLGNIYNTPLDIILSEEKKPHGICKNCVSHYGFYNSLM